MTLTLAFRNLFHDRVRLAVTLVGILFSIVLVAVQLGLYLGSSRMITAMIERANGELWVTAYGAKSFEDGGVLLTPRERHAALATPGVKAVIPMIVAFAEWRKPGSVSSTSFTPRGITIRTWKRNSLSMQEWPTSRSRRFSAT